MINQAHLTAQEEMVVEMAAKLRQIRYNRNPVREAELLDEFANMKMAFVKQDLINTLAKEHSTAKRCDPKVEMTAVALAEHFAQTIPGALS